MSESVFKRKRIPSIADCYSGRYNISQVVLKKEETEKMPKLGNSYNLLTGSVLRGKFADFFLFLCVH